MLVVVVVGDLIVVVVEKVELVVELVEIIDVVGFGPGPGPGDTLVSRQLSNVG